jgi:GNAT superfamily N-acetyltransferase
VIEFRDVDLGDEQQLHTWYDVWAAAQSHRPPELVTPWAVARRSMPHPHPDFEYSLFTAFDDGVAVGVGLLNLPIADNPTVAYIEVAAHPDHQGRGVGGAVLAEVERRVSAAGRERPIVEVYTPPDGTSPGAAFAEAHGYTVANRETAKAIRLAEAEPRWAALEERVAGSLGGYRVEVFRDTLPEEHLAGYCAMLEQFMSEVPLGDLDLEDGAWTPERYRANERRRHEIGLSMISAVGLSPEGEVVGASDVRVSTHDPRVAYVGITLVLPGHRGHGLGLTTKLATHRALRADVPECRVVVTGNAEVNEHMNAINEALGYRRLETLLECHRTL